MCSISSVDNSIRSPVDMCAGSVPGVGWGEFEGFVLFGLEAFLLPLYHFFVGHLPRL